MNRPVFLFLCWAMCAVCHAVPTEPPDPDQSAEQRHQRLLAHFPTYQEWLRQTADLSEQQLTELQDFCDLEIRLSQISWLNDPNSKPQPRLTDFGPIEFTNIAGAAECIHRFRFRQVVRQLLTPDQLNATEAAEAERNTWLNTADTAYLTAAVDEHIQLSPEQWDALQENMTYLLQSSGSRLTSFEKGLCPVRIQGPISIFPIVSALELTYRQQRQLQALSDLLVPVQPLRFHCSTAEGGVEEALQTVFRNFRDQSQKMIEVAVLQLSDDWSLSERQADYLRLAGTGATIKYIESWKKLHADALKVQMAQHKRMQPVVAAQRQRMEQQLRIHLQAGGQNRIPEVFAVPDVRLPCTMPALRKDEVFAQPVWIRALEKISPADEAPEDQNRDRRHQAIVDFVTATVDREVWLRQAQREPVRRLVEQCLPPSVDQLREPGRELVWLALPLAKLQPDQLAELLDDKQLAAWNLLKAQFQFIDGTIVLTASSGKEYRYLLPQ